MEYDVIVAGVGGMGSATVAELASRGARVLGLDRASIPNDSGSSPRGQPHHPPGLRGGPALRAPAASRLRALARPGRRLGEPILVITGGLDMGAPDSETVTRRTGLGARAHGLDHELLDADALMARFPGFRCPPTASRCTSPTAASCSASVPSPDYARLALDAGADLRGHEPVIEWGPQAMAWWCRTTRASTGRGAWSSAPVPGWASSCPRSRGMAVPERQVLLWARTLRPERYAVGAFPVFILDVPEGLFYGFPEYGIPGLKIGLHAPPASRSSTPTPGIASLHRAGGRGRAARSHRAATCPMPTGRH